MWMLSYIQIFVRCVHMLYNSRMIIGCLHLAAVCLCAPSRCCNHCWLYCTERKPRAGGQKTLGDRGYIYIRMQLNTWHERFFVYYVNGR